MSIRNDDINWLENHLPCRVFNTQETVRKYAYNMPPFTSLDSYDMDPNTAVIYERVITLKIHESDLSWLIKCLKEVDTHRALQKKYPGVAQAYADYDITARMASYYEDGKSY